MYFYLFYTAYRVFVFSSFIFRLLRILEKKGLVKLSREQLDTGKDLCHG